MQGELRFSVPLTFLGLASWLLFFCLSFESQEAGKILDMKDGLEEEEEEVEEEEEGLCGFLLPHFIISAEEEGDLS